MAMDGERDYKARWEMAWAGLEPWSGILPLAVARCAAAQAAGDLRAEAEECSDVGFLLSQTGRAQEGIVAQRRELRLYRQIGDALEVARTLGSLGDALKKAGKLNSALRCWRAAMDWFFHTGNPLATFHGLIHIAILLKLAGRTQEAGDTFCLALSIAPDDHGGWSPTRILGELANLDLGTSAFPSIPIQCWKRQSMSLLQ
jgi:tetratricopeptide (TPR) repeat protein